MELFIELLSQPWASWGTATAVIVIHIVAVLTAFHSLQHVRTSQAVVAWVVGLITLPYLTLPLYWVFARHRFEGYREAIREVGKNHERSVVAIRRELISDADVSSTSRASPLEQIANVLDTPISQGNEFRLLVDGDEFFTTVLKQIQSATRYVYAEFYIIRDDDIGNRFADAIIERARAGVTVRLLYDEVGCLRLSSSYLVRLVEAGVDIHTFNTRQGWVNRFQINFRNHRKLIVVDGQRAVVGGLNVGDEYVGKAAWAGHWRDTGIAIQGKLTCKIQAVFAGDYYWAARANLPEADWEILQDEMADTGRAIACTTGPADVRPRAAMMFVAAINSARERLWISTPYLIPDNALMVALAMAKARGIDVRLLISGIADEWPVYLAGYHYERELAEVNIPVFRYNAGLLHQKCVLVDDSLAMIGSANLDNRSLYLNFELMIASNDRQIVTDVAAMLAQDFSNSTQSNGDDIPIRPWFARVGTAIARLFSPVL